MRYVDTAYGQRPPRRKCAFQVPTIRTLGSRCCVVQHGKCGNACCRLVAMEVFGAGWGQRCQSKISKPGATDSNFGGSFVGRWCDWFWSYSLFWSAKLPGAGDVLQFAG